MLKGDSKQHEGLDGLDVTTHTYLRVSYLTTKEDNSVFIGIVSMIGVMTTLLPCFAHCFFFLMIRRPPRSTPIKSSAASDVYKRQPQ